MKITLLVVGNTGSPFLKKGIEDYKKRINHYINFDIRTIPDIKKNNNLNEEIQKRKEGELILSNLKGGSSMILLDEAGKTFSSRGFSGLLQKKMASGLKELVFVVGGPYGFSDEVYKTVPERVSISKMTFPHELVRLIFVEQLYRAFTILKGEPYHHD